MALTVSRGQHRLFAAFAAAALVLSAPAEALDWKDLSPGVSTRAQVLSRLGRPTRETRRGGVIELVYLGRQAVVGTRQVHVQVGVKTGKVARIDVIPLAAFDLETIRNTFGGPCRTSAADPCYLKKLTPRGLPYLDFGPTGLQVYLDSRGKAAKSFSYMPARAAPPKEPAATPLEGRARWSDAPDEADSSKPEPTEKPDEAPTVAAEPSAEPSAEPTAAEPTAAEPKPEEAEPKPEEADWGLAPGAPSGASSSVLSAEAREQLEKDPLAIGGQFYLRSSLDVVKAASNRCCDGSLAAPFLIDAYFDGRPGNRVRAMARPRFLYDPLAQRSLALGLIQPGQETGANEVKVVLDQLWLSFDVASAIFVTIGRQHVKWGVSQLWSPTDFLAPAAKNPFAIFDERLGSDLLKVHVPWERLGANFYAIALVDAGGVDGALRPGGAFRTEWLLATAELGVGAVFQKGVRPRYAADLSVGLGPVDVYAELALRRQPDGPLYVEVPIDADDPEGPTTYEATRPVGRFLSGSGGISLPLKLSNNRSLTLGVEGFYQQQGYGDDRALPVVLTSGAYQPFYYGKAYTAAFVSFNVDEPAKSITLTTIGNLSDRSYVGRLDAAFYVYNALNVELFAEVPFGRQGGEFRPAFDLPEQGLHIPLSLLRLGLALRVNL